MIRVLITEDSPTIREIMKHILESDPEISVVGMAKNGRESIDKTRALKPDVITMDIQMPVMDGLEATRQIMETIPTSILIVSSIVSAEVTTSMDALKLGALDVLEKPKVMGGSSFEKMGGELIQRIKTVARVRPFKKTPLRANIPGKQARKVFSPLDAEERILAIGASTGGPAALGFILKELPRGYSHPIVITQHISRGFITGLKAMFNAMCSLRVKVGENGEEIRKGTIYLAPDNHHMGVTGGREIVLSDSTPITGHRPSIDFLMESVASVYKKNSMGVILTGMGRDGARGLGAIRKKGGLTVAQDEATSIIFGMPKAAIKEGAAQKICPLENIPGEILVWGMIKAVGSRQ